MMFTMYASPDSGYSSPLSALPPSCSAFDPLLSSPTRIASFSKIRRYLSYESIDNPSSKDASTQTVPELSVEDLERCERVGRRLRALCDDFDREFFQSDCQSETVPPAASLSYTSMFTNFVRNLF